MSFNGKRDDFTIDDFKAYGKNLPMKRGRAEAVIHEMHNAVLQWKQFADKPCVVADVVDRISKTHRTGILK